MNIFERLEGEPKHEPVVPSEKYSLPEFEKEDSPVVSVSIEPLGEVRLHHDNTLLVLHDEGGEYEHMDHILVVDEAQFDEPLYIFPEPVSLVDEVGDSELFPYDDMFDGLICYLQERKFSHMYNPGQPAKIVFEKYYKFIRGKTPIDTIITTIIGGAVEE